MFWTQPQLTQREEMDMARTLMVVTAADSITLADGIEHPTGFWAEELVTLRDELIRAGHTVEIATPGGLPAPVDPGSVDTDAIATAITELAPLLAAPLRLQDIEPGTYDAIVMPGGHGPMVDLAFNDHLGMVLVDAVDRGIPVAALCHGPAALLSAIRPDGSFAFAGKRVAVFTDSEERAGGLGETSPFFVETRLRGLGALIASGADWSSTAVNDGMLVTGQNPQSSLATANLLVSVLAAEESGGAA